MCWRPVGPFGDDRAPAREPEGKWGYLDPEGKWAIPPKFERALVFSWRIGGGEGAGRKVGVSETGWELGIGTEVYEGSCFYRWISGGVGTGRGRIGA